MQARKIALVLQNLNLYIVVDIILIILQYLHEAVEFRCSKLIPPALSIEDESTHWKEEAK